MADDRTGENGADGGNDNPLSLARAHSAPERIKRFYKAAQSVEKQGIFQLHLDGRAARTPGKNPLCTPYRRVADTLVEEWSAQGSHIDAATMPMTRLLNTAIDAVSSRIQPVRDDILAYAGTDLVCYRASNPAPLVARQAAAWDPVLSFAESRLGARFAIGTGVMHVSQPAAALAAIGEALDEFGEPSALAALHIATSLTGSALIALAVALGALTPDAAWDAAHVDEAWNIEQWGQDAEAAARQTARRDEFDAASIVLDSRAGGI